MKDEYIAHIIPGIEEEVKKYISDNKKEVFYIDKREPAWIS